MIRQQTNCAIDIIYSLPSGLTGPWGLLGLLTEKKVLEGKARPVGEADKLTDICGPII
jgi:hypothetical protein